MPVEHVGRAAHFLAELDTQDRYLFVKLIGGSFRVGVSNLLVQRALAAVSGLDKQDRRAAD